jgi:F420-dependent oxidoreductase-like protein
MKFGFNLPQGWTMDLAGVRPEAAFEAMARVARTADECGFASIQLADHLHTVPAASQEPFFECWTTASALARETQRTRVAMTTCNVYRSPALLAKMASTVDVLSQGRLDFGIGAGGANRSEYIAYGYNFPDVPTRLRMLDEAVRVILAIWTCEEASFQGTYYQVHGAICQPKGIQQPHIPLTIAGGGEKVTLKLVAQYGNACSVVGTPATLSRKFAALRQHCEKFGRDYETISRKATAHCSLAATDEDAWAKIPASLVTLHERLDVPIVAGSPDSVRAGLAELEAVGVQELYLSFPDVLDPESVRLFAQEFIP